MRLKKVIALLGYCVIASGIILSCGECFAAYSLRITGYTYRQNFTAGDTVTFTINVANTGQDVNDVYLSPVLTNQDTTVAVYPAASATANMTAGSTATFTTTWTAVAGKYSVTLIMHGTAPVADTEMTRVYGAWPIRVGSSAASEKLSAFPTVLNFGVLPYGRHMFNMPLEITWDFFLYNRIGHQQPWYMRIYTNNTTRYKSIKDSVYVGSPAGLVSTDGRYVIPLKVWCLNYPPEDQEMGWDSAMSGPPPVDDDTYWKGPILDSGERYDNKAAWIRVVDYSEMTSDRTTWRNLIGEDIYDTQYVTEVNPTGSFTLKSPFNVYFATECGPSAVKANYSCELIVEIYCP